MDNKYLKVLYEFFIPSMFLQSWERLTKWGKILSWVILPLYYIGAVLIFYVENMFMDNN